MVDVDRHGLLGTMNRAMLPLAGSGRVRIPGEPGEVIDGYCGSDIGGAGTQGARIV